MVTLNCLKYGKSELFGWINLNLKNKEDRESFGTYIKIRAIRVFFHLGIFLLIPTVFTFTYNSFFEGKDGKNVANKWLQQLKFCWFGFCIGITFLSFGVAKKNNSFVHVTSSILVLTTGACNFWLLYGFFRDLEAGISPGARRSA